VSGFGLAAHLVVTSLSPFSFSLVCGVCRLRSRHSCLAVLYQWNSDEHPAPRPLLPVCAPLLDRWVDLLPWIQRAEPRPSAAAGPNRSFWALPPARRRYRGRNRAGRAPAVVTIDTERTVTSTDGAHMDLFTRWSRLKADHFLSFGMYFESALRPTRDPDANAPSGGRAAGVIFQARNGPGSHQCPTVVRRENTLFCGPQDGRPG